MSLLRRYWNFLATWRKHRETIKVLNRLSNKELKDIGLTRGEINNLIWLDTDRIQRGGQ